MQIERIEALLNQLTPEQRQDYERLLVELSDHGGDLTKLSAQDQQTLAELSAAMSPPVAEVDSSESQKDTELTAEIIEDTKLANPAQVPQLSPSTTPFGLYVVEQLKTLCEGGSSLADAVRYSFHNKYLPVTLKDDAICAQIYQRHQIEIDEITAKMQSVNRDQAKEAKVIVGLAWFSMLYQCYQYVEAYGDLH